MSESKPAVPATPVEGRKVISMTVLDRIVTPQFFPERSNMRDHHIAKDIAAKVALTEDEEKEIDFQKFGENRVRWDGPKAEGKDREFDFTNPEISFLKDQIERLDKAEAISRDMVDLIFKIQKL